MATVDAPMRSATISVLVENESGVLARVIGLFSGRGYNIDSLTVAPVDSARGQSRINVVTSGTEMVIAQIMAQLDRLVPVHRVSELSREPHIARELALIKVVATGNDRSESLRIAEAFRARVIDATRRELRLRVDGRDGKDRRFPGPDAALGVGGDFSQWRCCDRPRGADDLRPPAAVRGWLGRARP